jgi:hypothetical protein
MHHDPGIALSIQLAIKEAEEFIFARTSIHDGNPGAPASAESDLGSMGLHSEYRAGNGTLHCSFRISQFPRDDAWEVASNARACQLAKQVEPAAEGRVVDGV